MLDINFKLLYNVTIANNNSSVQRTVSIFLGTPVVAPAGVPIFFIGMTDGNLKSRLTANLRVGIEAVKILLEKLLNYSVQKKVKNVPKLLALSRPDNQLPAEILSRHLRLLNSKSTYADKIIYCRVLEVLCLKENI